MASFVYVLAIILHCESYYITFFIACTVLQISVTTEAIYPISCCCVNGPTVHSTWHWNALILYGVTQQITLNHHAQT